jgi:hypothetical protein
LQNLNQVRIVISGGYPDAGNVKLHVFPAVTEKFRITLRIPFWSRQTRVRIASEEYTPQPGSWLKLERVWTPGAEIEMELDLSLQVHHAPDGSGLVALQYGPIVLAQDSRLGTVGRKLPPIPDKLALRPEAPPPGIARLYRLPDDTLLCDYASAGNRFSDDNTLCVWMHSEDR